MLKLALCLLISCEALEVVRVSSSSCSGTECGKYWSWVHQGPEGDLDQALVVVSISVQLQNIAASSLTATFGARSMDVAGEFYTDNPPHGIRGIKIFYLYEQDAGSGLQNVKIDWFGQTEDDTDALVAGCVTYLGVKQNAPLRFYGGSKEVTTQDSRVGNVIQDVVLFAKNGSTPVATGTKLWLSSTNSSQGGAQFKPGATGSVLMEWEPLGPAGVYAAGAIEIVATTSSRAPSSPTATPTASPIKAPTPDLKTVSPSSSQPPSSITNSSFAPTSLYPSPTSAPSGFVTNAPSTSFTPTTGSPTPTGSRASQQEKFPWPVIWGLVIGVPLLLLAGCGYYVFRLKRRVYKAEELFLAPSDFAKLVQSPEEAEEIDPDALDFSDSRQSRSILN